MSKERWSGSEPEERWHPFKHPESNGWVLKNLIYSSKSNELTESNLIIENVRVYSNINLKKMNIIKKKKRALSQNKVSIIHKTGKKILI